MKVGGHWAELDVCYFLLVPRDGPNGRASRIISVFVSQQEPTPAECVLKRARAVWE